MFVHTQDCCVQPEALYLHSGGMPSMQITMEWALLALCHAVALCTFYEDIHKDMPVKMSICACVWIFAQKWYVNVYIWICLFKMLIF